MDKGQINSKLVIEQGQGADQLGTCDRTETRIMNGCVLPGTPIAVDFWKVRECPQAKVFFLTHLHGDHIVGLTSSWQQQIFCSEVTASLLSRICGVRNDLIQVLYPGNGYIVYLDVEKKEQMTVNMFDANHCPGSAMFLFEGYFGKIFYTGDFRLNEDMLTQLTVSGCVNSLDVLYLDNTYCTPYSDFPTREEALEEIVNVIREHPCHDIVLGLRSLGKENILVTVASEFEEYIAVPANVLRNAEVLKLPDVFLRTDSHARIRVVPFHCISKKNVTKWNQEIPTVVIMPTALYVGLDFCPFVNVENVYVIPYSDHSSYKELLKFVDILKPKSVVPIVSAKTRGPFGLSVVDRADMQCFVRFLSTDSKKEFTIPVSVEKYMFNTSAISSGVSNSKGRRICARKSKRKAKNIVRGVEFIDDNHRALEDNMVIKDNMVINLSEENIPTSAVYPTGFKQGSRVENCTALLRPDYMVTEKLRESNSTKSPHLYSDDISDKRECNNRDVLSLHTDEDVSDSALTMGNVTHFCSLGIKGYNDNKDIVTSPESAPLVQDVDFKNTIQHDSKSSRHEIPSILIASKLPREINVIPIQDRPRRCEQSYRTLLNKIVHTRDEKYD